MLDWNASRDESLRFMMQRINYEQTRTIPYGPEQLKLCRMRRLLSELRDPHKLLTVVHVAGSKGKGSTATMLAMAGTHAGYRTGLYTSPHLEHIEERFAIDGTICTGEQFADLMQQIIPAVKRMDDEGLNPTYFDICTGLAFLWFAQQKVDLAVIEVGMGGRLDSTNVCEPRLTIITSISLDHTQQLGTTLPAIAGEKAGIIKPGIPIISGVEDPAASAVIASRAAELACPRRQRGDDFWWNQPTAEGPLSVTYRKLEQERTWDNVHLGMPGAHQASNAAIVLVACDELRSAGFAIPDSAALAAIRQTQCPARIEQLGTEPRIILDAAHNVASIEALLAVLQVHPIAGTKWLLFAAAQGKDIRGILARLARFFDRIVLTEFQSNPRRVPLRNLDQIMQSVALDHATWECIEQPIEAWRSISAQAQRQDLICITGSFFLAAELRPLLQKL
ncbi:MAG: bifunctional folylpolyglutamate synthase/dihydrofolate synthase [Planctomycetota bacterium]|nr:bifunctional folylpolyglutamate synthase/dihydrofolate synthase [Planctomycetota bacterium]MDA1179285.1 bifunctional folylpolyglutamate synthase/dihydrofolate synthase [Planctomycetota bacterium]